MRRLATALFAGLLLAGCGGGGDDQPDRQTRSTPTSTPSGEDRAEPRGSATPAPPTGPVTKAEKAVIVGWTDALRNGEIERAASYWRVPAIAANGSQPFRLVTRAAVRQFNEGLTCGAKVESVERDQRYVVATFRLTNRKGRPGACGQGVGNRARTVFLLREGKIAQWIRASDPPDAGDLPDSSTS
jgi:hypothetical protein